MSEPVNTILEVQVGRIVRLVQEATKEERAGGLVWYPAFSRAIGAYGEARGLSREQSLALFAALSPQARIQRNWTNFKAACDTHTTQGCVCLTGKHRAKIAAFLAGLTTTDQVISGDKVSSFYANLAGDMGRVTIDRHARAAALGMVPEDQRISHADYKHFTLVYRAAAKLLDLEPAQVQAIAWTVWRRMQGIKDDGGLSLVE
jgi:hypothetical protein